MEQRASSLLLNSRRSVDLFHCCSIRSESLERGELRFPATYNNYSVRHFRTVLSTRDFPMHFCPIIAIFVNSTLLLLLVAVASMGSSSINSGALVNLQELTSASPHFRQGASLRVIGKLQDYNVESAIATVVDGSASLKIDTQHLSLNLRVGSFYQFIGELHIQPNNEGVLKARVGRNVDGIDLNLYNQSLQLLKEFQAGLIHAPTT